MNQSGPERRRARISRQQILETASHLLQEHGARGVSIRKIASLIPCAPPSIYYYFTNKEDILDALVEVPLGELIEALDRVRLSSSEPQAILMAYARFWLERRSQMSLLFLPGHWGQQSLFRHYRYRQVEALIEEALGGDPLRAEGYLGLVNGLLFKIQNSDFPTERAIQMVDQTLKRVL
ncbi:TetR/AcrR family transcriptional regulator [Natronospirillum operosum]|nr:TetR/AcrR family transcriptional regulator [Natronospirillum operosum]